MLDFGKRLQYARERKGMTQFQVMRITHISNKAISRYENNTSFPDLDIILQLLALYDVSADYLFGLSDDMGNSVIKNSKRVLSENADTELNKLSADSLTKVEEYIHMVYVFEKAKKRKAASNH